MKQLLTTLLLFWSINIFAQQTYDIVIVGGTPSHGTALGHCIRKPSVIVIRDAVRIRTVHPEEKRCCRWFGKKEA